ncbi:DUF1697 domain-containing protein [Archangium primigenium]|uniref:DUF1697 domain-containing protein n=1 Tax=[Archangium] primigenium TaxID=2792470 RepID=UPI0019560AB7|nr:DUF1697 domain-containing protein [Archangium primigenium]
MARFIVLLRGINVGGHRKVPMAELRALGEGLGFTDVASYIQSGNLVVTAPGPAAAVEASLEQAIAQRFGFEVDVLARTPAQWTGYMKDNPLREASDAEPQRVMLVLAKAPPRAEAVEALRARATTERLEASKGALWVHYPEGAGVSKLSPALWERCVGSPVTARNWGTVLKLAAMVEA